MGGANKIKGILLSLANNLPLKYLLTVTPPGDEPIKMNRDSEITTSVIYSFNHMKYSKIAIVKATAKITIKIP
jgi:hypothetical protein